MVKERSIAFVVILSLITFGIYLIYWLYSTTVELRDDLKVKDAPKTWWIIMFFIPFVNIVFAILYYWKYSKAIEKISKGKRSAALMMVLFLFIGVVAVALAQMELNKKAK